MKKLRDLTRRARAACLMLVGLALSGCATDPASLGMLLQAQADIAKRPTLVVDCPAGCNVQYTDPRDKALNLRMPTNGYDAAVAISGQLAGVVSGAVPYAALAGVAVRGLDRAGGNDSSVTNNQIGPNSQNAATTTSTATDNSNQHNATATPTVVEQPPVTVVTQPPVTVVAPVVVRPEVATP